MIVSYGSNKTDADEVQCAKFDRPVLIRVLTSKVEFCVFFMWNAGEGSVSLESSRMSFHRVNVVFVVGKESEPYVFVECLQSKVF